MMRFPDCGGDGPVVLDDELRIYQEASSGSRPLALPSLCVTK